MLRKIIILAIIAYALFFFYNKFIATSNESSIKNKAIRNNLDELEIKYLEKAESYTKDPQQ